MGHGELGQAVSAVSAIGEYHLQPVRALFEFAGYLQDHYGSIVVLHISRMDDERQDWNLAEYDKAIAEFSETIRSDCEVINSYYYRALSYFDSKRFDKAIAGFDKIIKRRPKDTEAHSRRATAWQIDEPKLLASAEDDEKSCVRCYLGLAALQEGKVANARSHFRWVTKQNEVNSSYFLIARAELARFAKEEPGQPRH